MRRCARARGLNHCAWGSEKRVGVGVGNSSCYLPVILKLSAAFSFKMRSLSAISPHVADPMMQEKLNNNKKKKHQNKSTNKTSTPEQYIASYIYKFTQHYLSNYHNKCTRLQLYLSTYWSVKKKNFKCSFICF